MTTTAPQTTYRLVLQVFEKQDDDSEKECFVAAWLHADSPDQAKEFARNYLAAQNCRVAATWAGPEPVTEWTSANAAARVRAEVDGTYFEVHEYD